MYVDKRTHKQFLTRNSKSTLMFRLANALDRKNTQTHKTSKLAFMYVDKQTDKQFLIRNSNMREVAILASPRFSNRQTFMVYFPSYVKSTTFRH
jgi:hypothetical protein